MRKRARVLLRTVFAAVQWQERNLKIEKTEGSRREKESEDLTRVEDIIVAEDPTRVLGDWVVQNGSG